MATPANGKDTVYIDIDDEITTIIEKVRASSEKIVALVLPKRATVLQSIVNMKLLKRTADAESKRVVLITAESGLMPLAAATGMYVAKSLQTKPEIPAAAATPGDADDVAEEAELDNAEEITPATAGDRPIGELAGMTAPLAAEDAIETVELDAAGSSDAADTADKAAPAKASKPKKDKKLAVPNFERFRLLLIGGGVLLLLLIIGGVYAATALPKAQIVLKTDTSNINSSITFTADTKANSLNTDGSKPVVPATQQQVQKTQTQQVATTGKQNNGQKATGDVTFSTSCTKKPDSVGPGVGVSGNSLTFITTDTLKFDGFNVDGSGNFVCSGTVPVVAQQGGSNYNLPANTTFRMANVGYSGTNSDAFSGGTDDIIQVVSQSDIDNATQKISAQDTSAVKQQLQNQLKAAGLFSLLATFSAGSPNTTTSSNVGDQATTVTVTQNISYTMLGVKEADLKSLVDSDIKDKIDTSKQSILSEGLDKANFHVNTSTANTSLIAMTTTATAGPDLHADQLKAQIAGKKAGEVRDMLKSNPGVSDVKVQLSPFWVTKVPSKADRVTITFQKAN